MRHGARRGAPLLPPAPRSRVARRVRHCDLGIDLRLRAEALLARYAAAVATWSGTARAAFAAATFSVAGVSLVADGSPDVPLADRGSGLPPSYAPLRFSLPAGAAAAAFFGNAAVPYNLSTALALQLVANGSSLPVTAPLPLFRQSWQSIASKTGGAAQTCVSVYSGLWDASSSTCYMYDALTSVCVQVSPGSSGAWQLDSSLGGYGCDPASGFAGPSSTYVRVLATGTTKAAPFAAPLSFANLSVTVRSASDPLLAALALTGGSLNFGVGASPLLALFWAMLVVAFLLAGRPLLVLCLAVREDAAWWRDLVALCLAPCCCRGASSEQLDEHASDASEGEAEADAVRLDFSRFHTLATTAAPVAEDEGSPRLRASRAVANTAGARRTANIAGDPAPVSSSSSSSTAPVAPAHPTLLAKAQGRQERERFF